MSDKNRPEPQQHISIKTVTQTTPVWIPPALGMTETSIPPTVSIIGGSSISPTVSMSEGSSFPSFNRSFAESPVGEGAYGQGTYGQGAFGGSTFGESTFGGVVDPPTDPVDLDFEEMEPGSFDDEPAMGTFIETEKLVLHRSNTPIPPPGWAEELIDNALPIDEAEEVLGDLAEAYQHRALKNPARAVRWYCAQAIRIVLERYIRMLFPIKEKA